MKKQIPISRDLLMERLVAEDLVKIDGKMATASSYVKFVEGLHERKEFPEPVDHWTEVERKSQWAS